MGSTPAARWRSARTGRASTSPPATSDAVARLNRNTTTGAITQPAGTAGCISETGAGPCADGHGLDGPYSGGGQPGREERLRRLGSRSDAVARLNRNTTTGAITQPAGTAGCVSETGAGPCADGHGLDGARSGWRSARTGRASTSPRSAATPWRASTATRPPGRSPSPPGPPAASARRGRGPAPTAMGSTARTRWRSSPDGKSVYVASYVSDAVARLNRNTTTGAITQPAGTAGCVSETGAGPCADGHGLDGAVRGGGEPDGKSVYVASLDSDAVARFNRALSPFVETRRHEAGRSRGTPTGSRASTSTTRTAGTTAGTRWRAARPSVTRSRRSVPARRLFEPGSSSRWPPPAGSGTGAAFDHTLAVARAHGVKVIATLDQPMGRLRSRAGTRTDSWYTDGYKQLDPAGIVSYRDWVARSCPATANDPTILAWQLINEAEVKPSRDGSCCSPNAAATLKSFATDVSGLVKSIDRNHLVSLGTIGGGQCGAHSARVQGRPQRADDRPLRVPRLRRAARPHAR